MVSFQGSVLGALLTLLGWDGTDFRNVKVDSSGHLQVDVLSNVLGGDQATETTLALVKAQIGALTTPASGSTNKLLTDIEAQLPDQLLGYFDTYREAVSDLSADTGNNDILTTAVAAGKLHIITDIVMFNATTQNTDDHLGVLSSAVFYPMQRGPAPAASVAAVWQGQQILKEGEQIRAFYSGCTAGDGLYMYVNGWKATVA